MPSQHRQKPLKKEDAEKILKIYLDMSRNPNLKTGKIKETNSTFSAEVVTKKDESLVDIIAMDKQTGRKRSVY